MSYGNPGTSTDYTYDANGNLKSDANKNITSITYNHLNLPELIIFDNNINNSIEYIYDATGVKLEKIVKESGQTDKITDYVGGVVYEGNVRKFMSTEEGRIMLESTPEYQYHMKDHLGNVRLTFTTASSAQQTSTYLATMETEVTTLEAATFNNIEATQTEDKIYNHTPGGKASARLNAAEDRVMGPSMTLKVMPGDTVRMKVQAKYFKKAKSKDPIAGMASIVAASMGAGTISEAPQIAQGIQETLGLGQAGLVSKDNTIPKAYINYLFFDKENNFKKGGYKQVSEAALGSFEELDLEYVPEEEGTMMIYTANQTAEDLDVYMDDLTILHTEGPIIRVDDYYPFGMTYHTSERTGYTTNNFLYNGKELTSELDLDWYDYGARMYDASVGRWSVIDPLADAYNSYSPYNYVLNQPTQAIDPDGMSLNYWGDDYHVDTKSQTVTKVETDWADRIFVNGQLQYEGKSDGELDGYVDVDEYYHDYSQFFNEKYGDRLLNDSFFAKQLNLLGDNELKSQLIEARVRQAINTYGVEVVMYILEVYGTVVTIGELSAIIDGLGPVAKTYIKKYLKDRANKKVIQNAAKGDSMIKEGLKLIDDMFQNRRFQKYLKDQGLKSNNYLEQKLDDLLYESQLDELIKNYMKN